MSNITFLDNDLSIVGWLTVSQAVDKSKYCLSQLYWLVSTGKIESAGVGHTILLNEKSLIDYSVKPKTRGRPTKRKS